MKKYKVLKEYPGSPKEGTEVHLVKPIVGFVYYADKDNKFHIPKEHVENYPEYYERILSTQERVQIEIKREILDRDYKEMFGWEYTGHDGMEFILAFDNALYHLSKTTQKILAETPETIHRKVRTESWWRTVDKNDKYLIKLFSQMLGSAEQRIEQLYIIRNNLGL